MAYPTDRHYDKNRPSWVPYWWDTPTEIRKLKAVGGGTIFSDLEYYNPWTIGDFNFDLEPQKVSNPVNVGTTPYPAPPAPQTKKEMLTWTPEDLDKANKVQHVKWAKTLFDPTPKGQDPDEKEFMEKLVFYGIIGVGVYIGISLIGGRK